MNNFKVSIITITLNSEKYLEKTISSVITQTYPNKEYIIIDGASTDSTLDIVKKHSNHIDKWISEPDDGIADAMNKGLSFATGDYILFLHSDDFLADEKALEKASQYLDTEHDIFLFNIFYLEDEKKTLIKPRGLKWWINFKTGVLHQGTICSKDLFKKIGNFDTQFSIAMDYDFFLRAYKFGVRSKIIDCPLSIMRTTGISFKKDWITLQKRFSEERQIHKKNCRSILMKFLYFFYWPAYLIYRRFLAFSST
jgi:glycosyltransferase involved in cell wall biosynthesis